MDAVAEVPVTAKLTSQIALGSYQFVLDRVFSQDHYPSRMAGATDQSTWGGRVLVVGSTNVARSALAERVLREGLDRTGIKVTSCGTAATDGSTMDARMARQLTGGSTTGTLMRGCSRQRWSKMRI